MLALTFSDLTTSGAIGVIVTIFAVLGLFRGLVRTAFSLVALAAGILAGLWGFKNGASVAGTVIADPEPWMSAAVAAILGLAIFFVARALFGVLLSPVGAKDGKAKNLGLPGGLLGLIMGAAFAWFCLSGVRYIGTLSELQWVRTVSKDLDKAEESPQPLFSKLKRGLDASAPGQFHEKFDFLNNGAHANLAKLSVLADPDYGRALKLALVDKAIRDAVEQEQVNLVLLNETAQLKSYYEKGQFSQLLHSDAIKEACLNENAAAVLTALDIEKSLGLIKEEEKEKEKEKKQ